MGLSYGIGICEQALVYLSSGKSLSKRIANAIAELEVMKYENELAPDLSPEHGKAVQMLYDDYSSANGDETELEALSQRIVYLCTKIIRANLGDQDS